ncbi:MAG: hypothetical protein LJE91_07430 [Gammaproteobacteria bacterium]|nr:hypothetical protein [Gammaproteobacteria bacterium]
MPPPRPRVIAVSTSGGNRLDVPTLVIATDAGVDTVQRSRMPPLREGLIESHGKNRNAFCHDRIQEAAYRRIPAERRARLHYQVGTLRLQTPGELTNERLFEIADHIDQALAGYRRVFAVYRTQSAGCRLHPAVRRLRGRLQLL